MMDGESEQPNPWLHDSRGGMFIQYNDVWVGQARFGGPWYLVGWAWRKKYGSVPYVLLELWQERPRPENPAGPPVCRPRRQRLYIPVEAVPEVVRLMEQAAAKAVELWRRPDMDAPTDSPSP